MDELISVLVPAYNAEKFLNRCIDSILAQTYKELEIIIVNDGSKDRTGEICDAYAENYNRIKVFHQDNGGVSKARNKALDSASGKYICFVDSDDCVHPMYCETLYNMLKKENADITQVGYLKFDEEIPSGEAVKEYTVCDKYYPLEQMAVDYAWIVPWGKLYRREIFEGLRYPVDVNHEDEFIAHKLYYNISKLVYSKSPLYYYYTNENSIMRKQYNPSRLSALKALKERLAFYEEHKEERLAQVTIMEYLAMSKRNYYLVKQELGDEQLCDKIKEEHNQLFRENKNRCGINFIFYPELYIIPCSFIESACTIVYRAKRKLGLKCW